MIAVIQSWFVGLFYNEMSFKNCTNNTQFMYSWFVYNATLVPE